MLNEFKTDLKSLTSDQLVLKYVIEGGSYLLKDDLHHELKNRVSEYFKIEFSDIVLVGSAKLGFSIKSSKRYQEFGEASDIDIAIVSRALFEQIWEELFLYKQSGAYWPKKQKFFRYLSEGWIRPDLLPISNYFTFTAEWWDFFNQLGASNVFGPYAIRAGLYHSSFFFQEYQKINIQQCIEEIA
jgi:hypothetical protein